MEQCRSLFFRYFFLERATPGLYDLFRVNGHEERESDGHRSPTNLLIRLSDANKLRPLYSQILKLRYLLKQHT